MQPIFDEQFKMWKDFGFDLERESYWLDNGIIKGFTSDGELHNLYKYKVKYTDDEREYCIEITKHKDYIKSKDL